MSSQASASILAVCVDENTANEISGGAGFLTATSGRQAIDLLRMLKFDLLITGTQLPDMNVFGFVSRVKTAWPWQKWAMVARHLNPQDEVVARTLGVVRIFDEEIESEDLFEIARRVQDRANGLQTQPVDAQNA